MSDINEYFADKCGATLYVAKEINEHGQYWYNAHGEDFDFEWSIQDPRCREIIRERFGIDTDNISKTYWVSGKNTVNASGKTIAEAEIACLEAIHEANNE